MQEGIHGVFNLPEMAKIIFFVLEIFETGNANKLFAGNIVTLQVHIHTGRMTTRWLIVMLLASPIPNRHREWLLVASPIPNRHRQWQLQLFWIHFQKNNFLSQLMFKGNKSYRSGDFRRTPCLILSNPFICRKQQPNGITLRLTLNGRSVDSSSPPLPVLVTKCRYHEEPSLHVGMKTSGPDDAPIAF
jgi:hypothetical protein